MRKVLIVLLVLLLGGLFAADRFAESRAEAEVARQVANEYGLASTPSVEFGGWSFLAQAIGGTYDSVDVKIGDYTDHYATGVYDEKGTTLHDVSVRLEGLHAPLSDVMSGDATGITADRATATGVIPYETIQEALASRGVTAVSQSPEGHVLARGVYPAPLMGQVPVEVTVSLRVTDQGVAVVPEKVAAVGIQLPLDAVKQAFTYTIPVTDLAFGAKITAVVPVATGLRVTGEAVNVPLNQRA
ncbi:DUF2993 domain-containing protein [Actinocorallia sp. API 0066]|uniref:LmeA family phospholipid-binding protein n=1 Tax=Actinocorallia sp. API 0066 TaxID=2896846 RepID=UPI001E32794F|nr:DUF2993 domain-containing protein [Actinocorallia sp. API 0066]MCD0450363.1 DUF2993 domain-containing protein [Actinocorallia sp. API 0066]